MLTFLQIFNITKPWHILPEDLEAGDKVLYVSKYNEGARLFPDTAVVAKRSGRSVTLSLGGEGMGRLVHTNQNAFQSYWLILRQLA